LTREYVHFFDCILAASPYKEIDYERSAEEALRMRGDYSDFYDLPNPAMAEEALRMRGDYSTEIMLGGIRVG